MRFRTTATLAAMYANAHLPAGEKVTAEDFVPGCQRPDGTLSLDEQKAMWRGWAEAHNARVR